MLTGDKPADPAAEDEEIAALIASTPLRSTPAIHYPQFEAQRAEILRRQAAQAEEPPHGG